MGRILWYAAVTWDYIRQMLPGILLAAAVFFAVRPWRKKRLVRLELTSSPRREAALLLFAAFCAGLAALTLFPSGFWETFLRLGCLRKGRSVWLSFSLGWSFWRRSGGSIGSPLFCSERRSGRGALIWSWPIP